MQNQFQINENVLIIRNAGYLQKAVVKEIITNEFLVFWNEGNETKSVIYLCTISSLANT